MTAVLWVSSCALPAVVALTLGLLGALEQEASARARRRLVAVAPATVLPAALLTIVTDTGTTLELPGLLLGTHLQLDLVARPLLLMTALLYSAALVAVHSARTERSAALCGFLLMSFVGNALVFTAGDAVTFYLAFALMSFSAYGLVVHDRTAAALRAGRIYLVLTVASELAVLAALLLVVSAGGLLLVDAPAAVAASDQVVLVVVLLLVGFGVKAGTVPLHVWLPLAHPASPPPASAVLSGAMIKAGLVGWLRFLPLGELAMPGWGTTLVVLALVGAFLALPLGVLQDDPKVALAYSSISQMGFLAVLVGTALATPELALPCTLAAVVYAVHHGQAKGALFLGVTVWRTHGDGLVRWWVLAGLLVSGLAVAGAPFGSGAVAKYAAKEAVAIDSPALLGVPLIDLLPLVGTVSTLLLMRFAHLLITGSRDAARGVDAAVLSWSALVVGGTALIWLTAAAWAPLVQVPDLDPVTVWDAVWPILLGLGVGGTVWAARARGLLSEPMRDRAMRLVPPGDLVVLEEATLRTVERARSRTGARLARWWRAGLARSDSALRRAGATLLAVGRGSEDALEEWRGSGVAVLLVAAAIGLVLWWST